MYLACGYQYKYVSDYIETGIVEIKLFKFSENDSSILTKV